MSKTITARATVDADGMIRLSLPFGEQHVGEEVEVTVEVTGPRRPVSEEEYQATLDELHGCIDDPTFEPRGRRVSAIEYPPGYRKMTPEEWKRFIMGTAGSIDDPTFVRPPALPLRDRGQIFD